MAIALKRNTSLIKLNLKGNDITGVGARILFQFIEANSNLAYLSLQKNELYKNIADDTFIGLELNRSLRELNLSDNNLADIHLSSLVNSLAINRSLLCLKLNKNCITSAGASMFAQLLKLNQSIKELHLKNKNIGDQGIKHLAVALKSNYGLNYLSLSADSDEMSLKFVDALQVNFSLTQIIDRQASQRNKLPKKIKEELDVNKYGSRADYNDIILPLLLIRGFSGHTGMQHLPIEIIFHILMFLKYDIPELTLAEVTGPPRAGLFTIEQGYEYAQRWRDKVVAFQALQC